VEEVGKVCRVITTCKKFLIFPYGCEDVYHRFPPNHVGGGSGEDPIKK